MTNFTISEDTLHYAAYFLERWNEKASDHKSTKAQKELRQLSNFLLENLYRPVYISVARHSKKDD